jgi:hypothetical protein
MYACWARSLWRDSSVPGGAVGLNASTAPAISPISSFRPRPGRITRKLPLASSRIALVSAAIGRAMVKTQNTQAPANSSATARPIRSDFRSEADICWATAAFSSSARPLASSTTLFANASMSFVIGSATSRARRSVSPSSLAMRAAVSADGSPEAARFAPSAIASLRAATIALTARFIKLSASSRIFCSRSRFSADFASLWDSSMNCCADL